MNRWIERYGANDWSADAYAVFRWALGLYLALHFAALVPWAAELWSSSGMLPDAALSPLAYAFPNVLSWLDAPAFVTMLVAAGAMLSLLLAVGLGDRPVAFFLWYLLACLFGRNPLIANPSLPFVGWLLLAHALVGPSRAQREAGGWRLPAPVFACAWLVMAAGYSYSGVTKLVSPSWLDGSALADVLANPLARPGPIRETVASLPGPLLSLASWAGLALELFFLPLALVPRLRPWIWTAMVGMHLTLIVLIDFADLTAGMLLVHLFTLDPRWIPGSPRDGSRRLRLPRTPPAAWDRPPGASVGRG